MGNLWFPIQKHPPNYQRLLSLMEADHQRVESLFEQIEDTDNTQAIQNCFNKIYKELMLHAHSEELVFYPIMRDYEDTEKHIEDAEEEHNSVKIPLEQMKNLSSDDDEFQTKMMYLRESVLHHVKEEESKVFEAVRTCMDEDQLKALGQEFQAAKAKLEPEIAGATPCFNKGWKG